MGLMTAEQSPSNSTEKLSFEELRKLDACLDRQLKETTKIEETSSSFSHFSFKKWARIISAIFAGVLFPFYVLIRSAVYLYSLYPLNGWICLLTGMGATCLLLLLYAMAASYRLTQKVRIHKYVRRGIVVLVMAYGFYGSVYLSGMNVKTDEIKSYYRTLHPILRVTLATTILADEKLVITDLKRTPDDYRTMNLPGRNKSMHYVQSTGFVHAVDLRTRGRPEWRNHIMQGVFELLGFHTLRHTGTADHLHVSLPVNNS